MAITEQHTPTARLLRRTAADLEILFGLWNGCREQFHDDGPFLLGEFSIADAFHLPLASRCLTYGIDINGAAETYVDAAMSHPLVAEWQSLAVSHPIGLQSYDGKPVVLASEPSVRPAIEEPVQQDLVVPKVQEPALPSEAAIQPSIEPTPEAIEPVTKVIEPAPKAIEPESEELDLPPFQADTQSRRDRDEEEPPILVRPREGRRLFQGAQMRRAAARRSASNLDEATADQGLDDNSAPKPERVVGIKPIGGGIRRRR